MESGNFDEAIEVLSQADRLKPADSTVTMYLKVARARKQNLPQLEAMRTYVKENPKDTDAKRKFVSFLSYSRQFSEAEPLIAELLEQIPNDGKLYNEIGVFYSDAGKNDKAAEAYRKAAELLPHHVIFLSLGHALDKLGRRQEALEAYKKAFDIKPDSIHVLKFYADALRDSGKRVEAIEIYKLAHGVEPANSPVLFNLGLLNAKTGKLDIAKQYLEILRAVDPPQAKLLARCIRVF
jgi:tetratricopeptide (TPR) repeat protein